MTKILVTGATGTVGSYLVRALRDRSVPVRAYVRDAGRGIERLGDDVELVVGDFGDQRALRRAMHGVDGVFLASPNGPRQAEYECAVIDAAGAAWVQRIVKLSALGAEIGSPLTFFDVHGRVEQHLWASGVPAAVLRPAFYLSNLFATAESVRTAGRVFGSLGDARIAMVDPRDVAAVAAAALLAAPGTPGVAGDAGYIRQVHTLTGPLAVTFTEVAEVLATVLGREVIFVDVPDAAARAALLDAGAPVWLADSFVTLFAMLRAGIHSTPTDGVAGLTGRPPRPVAEFVRDHLAVFGG
ncbi:hypothetical protein CC117_06990 [Parafrankia colletiae]|uniref:NmrA-like domain-containing protein n=1 Tax=Parafrankia colletiae TaxID=573497 RepID=A0A1S1QAP3_9ACTN|nr:NAD(P)H-binding protein [Parafrankia colletiae]MCK9899688.1 NAD(P)H-binding protein [Frankia sp. Cpl3]OHV30656.1 hypothetical protein CC117_06990 [Parafrankia colletiae]